MSDQLHKGAALPPRGQLRWHRIISPTQGRSLRCVITDDSFLAKWTHYVPPTLPCAETDDCHWCKAGIAPRYNGYASCLGGQRCEPHVLALTYFGCCQFTELLQKLGTLRGLEVTLSRQFKSDRAPVVVKVERRIPAAQLPPAFDVTDSLTRMWGVNKEFLMRGCRRLGADESAQKYIREEVERRAKPRPPAVYVPEEVG